MKFQDPRKKIRELEYEYTLDQKELGKILVISSLTLIIISVHLLLNIQPAVEEAQDTEEQLNQLETAVATEEFNSSMEALEDLEGTNLGDQMEYALSTFRGMQSTVENQEEVYQSLEKTSKTYQWMVLTGIIGFVSGIAVIYV